jgi:hypothetical protein
MPEECSAERPKFHVRGPVITKSLRVRPKPIETGPDACVEGTGIAQL